MRSANAWRPTHSVQVVRACSVAEFGIMLRADGFAYDGDAWYHDGGPSWRLHPDGRWEPLAPIPDARWIVYPLRRWF